MAEAPEMTVIVSNFSDLMPEAFSGVGIKYDTETFFMKFRSWVNFQEARLPTEDAKIGAFKYVLSDTATLWWNSIIAGQNVPATLNALKYLFYAKFRVTKTRQELKRELRECKYIPGVSCLPMLNKFQEISNKLDLPLEVQIEIFIRILPPNLRQFVVSRNTDNFDHVKLSVKSYQELIENDSVINTSIAFKNVTFTDTLCGVYKQDNKSDDCPSIKQIVDRHIEENVGSHASRNRSRDRQRPRYNNRSRSHSPDRGHSSYPDNNKMEWRDQLDYKPHSTPRRVYRDFSPHEKTNGRDYFPYYRTRNRGYSPYGRNRSYSLYDNRGHSPSYYRNYSPCDNRGHFPINKRNYSPYSTRDKYQYDRNNRNFGDQPRNYDGNNYRGNQNKLDYGFQDNQRYTNGSHFHRRGKGNGIGPPHNRQSRPNSNNGKNGLESHFNNMNINDISCFVNKNGTIFVKENVKKDF